MYPKPYSIYLRGTVTARNYGICVSSKGITVLSPTETAAGLPFIVAGLLASVSRRCGAKST